MSDLWEGVDTFLSYLENLDAFCQTRAEVLALGWPHAADAFLDWLGRYEIEFEGDLEIQFHRMRTVCTDLPQSMRVQSQRWLDDRNLPAFSAPAPKRPDGPIQPRLF